MSRFADGNGVNWDVLISVGTVRQCRELLEVDLCDVPSDFGLLQRIRSDDALLADLLYLCCRRQCEERGMSDEQFGELLTGDIIEAAEDAFWSGLTFFFRGARRTQLEKALQLQQEMEAAAIERLTPERQKLLLDRFTTATDQTLDRLFQEESSTGTASNGQASAE